jgi:AAA ATPase domain
MDQVRNPYNPGSGARPQQLAGRAAETEELDVALQRLLIGRNAKSQLITGLHGVGKTALLYEFSRLAGQRGFIHEHIEVGDDGMLPLRLAVALRKALLKLGGKKKVKGVNRRALGVLKAFTLTLPEGGSLLMDVDPVPGTSDSGDLASDLGGLFEEVGQAARAHESGVFLTVDEMHHLPAASFEALMVGLHRAHQSGLPMVIAGAGLPAFPAVSGEARSYLEQMFRFRPLGPLTPDEGADALLGPAASEGVGWKAGALTRTYEVTMGYPAFIQEFGKQAWDLAEEGSKVIRLSDVERSIPLATAELDEGFFAVRAARTTGPERAYLRAMAELGPGVVRSGEVAALLSKKTTQLAPVRDALMKKALCFSPRFNELAFTVPLFDQFMKRWIPSLAS